MLVSSLLRYSPAREFSGHDSPTRASVSASRTLSTASQPCYLSPSSTLPNQRPSRQAPLQRPRVPPPFCVFLSRFAWFPFHSHPRSIICWSPYPQQLTGAHAHSTRSQLHPCLCPAPSSAHTSSPPTQAHLSYVYLPCRVQQLWTLPHAAWPPGPSLDLLTHCCLPFDPF